jgi:periplasmic divalent cation tolerance protein
MNADKGARFAVVLVAAPNLKTARRLAGQAVKDRLAACVNIMPGLESHYAWKGKVEKAREVLLVMKTTRRQLPALWAYIRDAHPYETPEFLVLSVAGGSKGYLEWLAANVG